MNVTKETSTRFTDYTLTNVKELNGEEMYCFEATLNYRNFPIALVCNEGRGGCHRYIPKGTCDGGDLQKFENFAREWNKGNEYAGHEDGDALIYHLLTVAELNAVRTVIFILDDDDPFNGSPYYKASNPNGADYGILWEKTRQMLRTDKYVIRNPRIWNRKTSTFEKVEPIDSHKEV